MTQDAGKLSFSEDPADSVRDRNGGVLGITPCREGVGCILRQNVDFGHWQSGPLRQILNQSIEFRIILRATS